MKDILKLGFILFVITLIAAAFLGFANQVTSPIIEERKEIANQQSRKILLPEAEEFEYIDNKQSGNVAEIYRGIKGIDTVGYTIKTFPKGYGGEIELTVGILIDGKLSQIAFGQMEETPGLGSLSKEPAFKDQFNQVHIDQPFVVVKSGKSAENEIQAISGATITSKAVTDGVNKAISYYKENIE